jgi:hypothetical protein
MAHARRKLYEVYVSTKSPIAEEALRQIAAIYQIEAEIRGSSAENRRLVRQAGGRPIVEAMHTWLSHQLERISGRSEPAKAIRYSLNHHAASQTMPSRYRAVELSGQSFQSLLRDRTARASA